jgi:hypothetical protein
MVDPEAKPPMGMRLQTLEKFFGNDDDKVASEMERTLPTSPFL